MAEHVASGVIPGTIRDSRMMDEYQGNLRVFSDVRDYSANFNGKASSDLYVLKPNAGKLETIGRLTDVADGQGLYSAYFDEDQAMITTWVPELIQEYNIPPNDPLHAFDLSDPTKPIELSELVIPGVSTYLQRVDATHLVGIGYVDAGIRDWRQQVSLYDVSDLANLKVVDTWTSSQSIFSPNLGGQLQNALAVSFDPNSGLFSIATSAFNSNLKASLIVFKIDTSDQDPLQFLGQVGDEKAMAFRSAVVGDALMLISNVWLQSYSTKDLSVELDHELLANPTATDWLSGPENSTFQSNILSNDYVTDGRIIAVTSCKLGTVKILDDGASIEFQAQSVEGFGQSEQLTYTLLRKNGETYSGTINVTVYGSENYTTSPVDVDPTLTPVLQPTLKEKAVAVEGDINGDGEFAPLDALLLVNFLNLQSEQLRDGETLSAMSVSDAIMDLSGDGEITPFDALLIVNRLNAVAAARLASGEAPDESTAAVVNEVHSTDEALLSLLATSYADQEETIRMSRRR